MMTARIRSTLADCAVAMVAALIALAPMLARAADDVPIHAYLALALAPDGDRLASIEGEMPTNGGSPVIRDLVLRRLKGGDPVKIALPCGAVPQCWPDSPVWSPDGAHLTFTLRKPGSHARSIYQLDAASGTLTELLSFDGTIIGLRVGKDGRLAMLATEHASKEIGAVQAGARLTGDVDEQIHEQRIAVLDKGAVTWMSPPGLFVYEYDWLPDGSGFVGTAAPGDGDNNWWIAKLYRFEADGMAKALYAPPDHQHQIASPRLSADGGRVFFISGVMSDFGSTGGDIMAVGVNGGAVTDLTPMMPATATALTIGCDGRLVAELLRGDQTELVDFADSRPPAAPRLIWSGQERINLDQASLACAANGQSAILRERWDRAPEIDVGPLGRWQSLSHDNDAVTADFTVQSITWKSDAMTVQGWLLLPKSRPDGGKLPMITMIHGGPSSAETPEFASSIERLLLAHGYALFRPNPRGSYGQGAAFQAANVKDLGYGDLRDILAGIDAVEKIAPIDEARLGVMGHSYGGFMTMWTVTQTNRFKAAVASAGIANWQSYYGENGIDQWLIPFFGHSVYEDPKIYARSSPITFINKVQTPTFLWVGERDVECPSPQTQEFWHALRDHNVPTSMVIYADEGHHMVDPDHVADAQHRTLAWFDRYLK